MRQKTRILIYILIAIAVVIMGTLTMLNARQAGKPVSSAQEHIDLGRIYLTELSYEKAVLEFTEAIEIEPLNADAYLGLAEAYAGMGDTEKTIEVLEEGYEKTGDGRLKDMLENLQPIDEPVFTTTVPTFTVSEITSEEAVSESDAEVTANYVENGSYTIDIINDKEAHIEIFDEIINDEYIIERDYSRSDGEICMARFIEIDNITIGIWVWEFNTPWTWINAHSQIFIENANGGGTDLGLIYTGDKPYYTICNVDTGHKKLSIDVLIPEDFYFSFNDYKSIEFKTEQAFGR